MPRFLEDLKRIYTSDPMVGYRFAVDLPSDIPGFTTAEIEKVQGRVQAVSDELQESLRPGDQSYRNTKKKYINGYDTQDFNLSFLECTDNLVYEYFSAWRDLHIDLDDGILLTPKNYLKTIEVHRLDAKGKKIRTIIRRDCMILNIQNGGLSVSDDKPSILNIQFASHEFGWV